MVHKPKHKVHSFRGLLADGGQDEINLERSTLNLAYRIIKFELLPNQIGAGGGEHTCIISRESSLAATNTVDFSDPDLLGAGFINNSTASHTSPIVLISIFDNVLFSRNIFVSQYDNDGDRALNYYIELEEVPVTPSTLMQLKLGVARKLNLQEGEN